MARWFRLRFANRLSESPCALGQFPRKGRITQRQNVGKVPLGLPKTGRCQYPCHPRTNHFAQLPVAARHRRGTALGALTVPVRAPETPWQAPALLGSRHIASGRRMYPIQNTGVNLRRGPTESSGRPLDRSHAERVLYQLISLKRVAHIKGQLAIHTQHFHSAIDRVHIHNSDRT